MKAIITEVVTELGHLTIFRKSTLQYPFGDGRFYYTDKRFQGEAGPFLTVDSSIRHWTETVVPIAAAQYEASTRQESIGGVIDLRDPVDFVADKPVGPPQVSVEDVPNNVIYVDFVAKRRL